MPIHEYHCEDCNADFEHLDLKHSEKKSVDCPSCKSKKTTKKDMSNFSSTGGSGCGGCHGCGGGSCC